ncbi:DUF1800 domain-containing protein [Gelidibacter maritimus]|uniref:DUF1800 domain-containing protein n=1 Tax=Gelidibacter maritimus TaxID=2761487 RepID=A0A7W2R5E3_9FLAO|nr:DUF1800 domain-containing protein [Gelidibacter maritimus]MBA6154015.1 DUF1800 domain-containing protein [Gelidibacter maritimus]
METDHIQHLYFRAGFGIDPKTLEALSSKPRLFVVEQLFEKSQQATLLKLDLSEFESYLNSDTRRSRPDSDEMDLKALQKKSREKVMELNYGWIERMATSDAVLAEKMTLFWANVFVCQDNNIWYIQRYNNTLREHALGNFRNFVKAIAREASMSKYLNNRQNVKASPNENFARELMELFTLGIGNYTENDIKESARAFTGWSFKINGDFFLRPFKHDDGIKTFMGKTGNLDGDDIIDIICEQKQCARFICEKIYRYFVNPIVDEAHLKTLTDLFYKDYDIKNLMHYIFSADWFYETKNRGTKIKSPIELLVGIQKIVPLTFDKPLQLLYIQRIMGQVLLYPPNVAGWKEDRNWIDSNTLMFRMKLAAILLNNEIINVDEKGAFEDDFEMYYKRQANKKRLLKVTKYWDVFETNYGHLSPQKLKEILIISAIDNDTERFLSNLEIKNNKEFCIQLMSIPEYQLC